MLRQLTRYRKVLDLGLLLPLMMGASLLAFTQLPTLAVDRGTAEQAIQFVAESPMFKYILEARPDWTAAAYDTGNSYGIWRVQFWGKEERELGWADVSLIKKHIYAWESNIGATEKQRKQVYDKLLDFVSQSQEVRDLVGDPHQYDIWIDYNGWINTWFVYINKGGVDSLYVGVNNHSENLLDLNDLSLGMIYFPEVQSYEDWEKGQQAQVVTLAFGHTEVAAAVRDHDGWTTDVQRLDDGQWQVTFKADDKVLVTATVDLQSKQVTHINIEK